MTSSVCTPWATVDDATTKQREQVANDELLALKIDDASQLLYALTGRRWRGACVRTDVTLHVGCLCMARDGYPLPTYAWAERVGYDSRTLAVNDWGLQPWAIRLPDEPVREVTALAFNGTPLDLDAFRLTGNRDLWAQPRGTIWLRGDYVGSWTFGAAPPDLVKGATVTLAVELAAAAQGAKCRLPARVQSITREGVSMVLLDPLEFLDKGRTGIPEVDLVINALNPGRLAAPPRVLSPDLMPVAQSRPAAP